MMACKDAFVFLFFCFCFCFVLFCFFCPPDERKNPGWSDLIDYLRWLNRVMQDQEAPASDLNRKLIFSFFLLFS